MMSIFSIISEFVDIDNNQLEEINDKQPVFILLEVDNEDRFIQYDHFNEDFV